MGTCPNTNSTTKKKNPLRRTERAFLQVVEGEGFEPPVRSSRTTVFKTVALNRSATPPNAPQKYKLFWNNKGKKIFIFNNLQVLLNVIPFYNPKMDHKTIKTLGQLKKSGYTPKSIHQELRDNLIVAIKNQAKRFDGIIGYDESVLPEVEQALLSGHNILLLGLRGQAKTRIARQMTDMLDEFIPVVTGSELNDDPMDPISRFARELITDLGDETPVSWVHRSERYVEKLATPDVSIADLVGDLDPIKAANQKLSYSDERAIHFGLLPRAHRSIFVINELPDLQARIQVALFNILQEGDVQIRGFKLRLPLDIMFVFTANPEDYTNRGSIITPLKDRIQSQILTHYLDDIVKAKEITHQEAKVSAATKNRVSLHYVFSDIIERIAVVARKSELVDQKSGVSPRLTIAALENLYSTAERRMLLQDIDKGPARIADFWGIIPAMTGKIELIYEGEQAGPMEVAQQLILQAIKEKAIETFPDISKMSKRKTDPYETIRDWFAGGNQIELLKTSSDKVYLSELNKVEGLREMVVSLVDPPKADMGIWMELLLFALSDMEVVSRFRKTDSFAFGDQMGDMWKGLMEDE
jgi:magnesium chelatase subunit I